MKSRNLNFGDMKRKIAAAQGAFPNRGCVINNTIEIENKKFPRKIKLSPQPSRAQITLNSPS